MARKGSVVRSEMGGAFGAPGIQGAKGIYNHGQAPFDQPKSMGGGGIPEKFMETGPSNSPTPTQTSGRDTRAARRGTVQRQYGTSDT